MEVVKVAEKPAKERLSFNNQSRPVFFEMKNRVREYFDKTNENKTGNFNLYFKGFIFLSSFIAGYYICVFSPIELVWALPIYVIMGLAAAAMGFNLMHDGAHGSFSEKKWMNTIAAYSINFLGGDAILWKNKHNIIHHTYTNIEGYDQDIAQMPVFRLNSMQKKSSFHKYQHLYCFAVYGLSSLLWVFLLDYIKYFTGKIGNLKMSRFSTSDHLIFWATKIGYLLVYLALPIYFKGAVFALTGFFVFHFVLGLTLSVVFQLAHVVENTEFSAPPEIGKVEDEWALHQLKTTTNFATHNPLITWYTGGLNFQVEHHLFPNISHVHYPAINKIVKQVCYEMNVPYNEFPSFASAVNSHLQHLKEVGRD
jgi:linoleoyl-CoA desaturase